MKASCLICLTSRSRMMTRKNRKRMTTYLHKTRILIGLGLRRMIKIETLSLEIQENIIVEVYLIQTVCVAMGTVAQTMDATALAA